MSTLVIDRRGAEIEALPGVLRIRVAGQPVRDVPLALLERVVVLARVRVDSGALVALGDAGVPVVFLAPRRGRAVATLLGRPHNDLAVRAAQLEHAASAGWSRSWAQALVRRKLRAQWRLACRIGEVRPDLRRQVTAAQQAVADGIAALARDPGPDSLRGIEGVASRQLFALLAAALPASLGFRGRRRRPPPDPVNAALSLAYTMLHNDAVRAAYSAGLDPFVGFYHRPSFGRESMACDLVEPLRPRVDEWVWTMFRERRLRADHFDRDTGGGCFLGKSGRAVFFPAWEVAARPMRRALRRSALRLGRVLRERVRMEIVDEPHDEPEEASLP